MSETKYTITCSCACAEKLREVVAELERVERDYDHMREELAAKVRYIKRMKGWE